MKRTVFLPLLVVLLLAACTGNNDRRNMIREIERLEEELYADSLGPVDRQKAQEAIQAYDDFANAFSQDSLAPEYLYKSSEIAMNLEMSGKAVEGFRRILNDYPDFDKAPLCIFLQAFIYENQMQQYEEAKKLYREFLEKYPEHDLAEDALVSIQNMGKSLDELIKSWEQDK
jgi:TolA-binding protein